MRRPLALVLVAGAGSIALGACGGDDDVGEDRAQQVREAALEAGLPEDVADVLALAARGATATFQLTYPGEDGAEIVVSQDPPNRRVDVLDAGLIVRSQVVRGEVSYTCVVPEGGRPGDDLECERSSGAVPASGTFTAEALEDFAVDLADSRDAMDFTVESREVAGVDATCLVTAPVAGTPIDGEGPGVDTICLAPDGAQLLVDAGGERVVAESYRTSVPAGTFDV